MKHLLSSCPEALGDGRYCWHHDQVLKAVAESIAIAINASKSHHRTKTIMFHRAGEKPNVPPQTKAGLLTSLNDWQLEVDLGMQLKFPQDCTNQATTRHDHYLRFHQATDNSGAYRAMGGTYEGGQRAKYQELVEECWRQGWKTFCEPLEVSCPGSAGRSLCRVFTWLGLVGDTKQKAIKAATEAAEKATRCMWIKSADSWANAAGTHA